MDETGIEHQSTKKKYVWAKRGVKVFGEKSASLRKRTSIIAEYKRKDNNINININNISNINIDNINKNNINISNISNINNENKELIAPFYFEGHTTSEVFITWLEKVLLPVWNKEDILVMDNASWHKKKK